jgi:hypothetical protein
LKHFVDARAALLGGPLTAEARSHLTQQQIESISTYQKQHERLSEDWQQGKLSARQLRIELVRFYVDQGKKQLNQRFFTRAVE